jgi:hypothetical protein
MTDILYAREGSAYGQVRVAIAQGRADEVVLRGKKPRRIDEDVSRVYFVDQERVYVWAVYFGYRHKSGPNLQGKHHSGGSIGVRGPARSLRPPIPVPSDELRGQWRWRYITPRLARRLRRTEA